MAGELSSKLTAVCFFASFTWLASTLDRHSLFDKPRLSAFLLLFISGCLVFVISFFSNRLPGADGRFDSEAALKVGRASLPPRPRRFYVPCIIFLIVARLEILHRVVFSFQCAVPGIEAFLPLLLAVYTFVSSSRRQSHVSDEPEEMWGDFWEDFMAWLPGSKVSLVLSTLGFTYGAFRAAGLTPRSSYYCSTLVDSRSTVTLLQWTGLCIDATILVLLWRVLSWSRTTKTRLRTLSGVLIASSVAAGLLWLLFSKFQNRAIMSSQNFRGLDSIYIFDVLSSGSVCAALVVSFALWICDSSPLTPAGIATFVSGVSATIEQLLFLGTYAQPKAWEPLLALSLISLGFTVFTYTHNVRSVIFVPRVLLSLVLAFLILTVSIVALMYNPRFDRHPVNEFVYKNRIEADRWLRHATVSGSLRLAVDEYRDRHSGRNPPRGFNKWYDFALEKNSVVIDRYDQIERDILPFWGLSPAQIRDGLEVVKALPDVGIIKILDQKAFHNQPADPTQKKVMDEAVSMISTFSQHLPDMSIAINLKERPRILVPWDDLERLTIKAKKGAFALLPKSLGKRQEQSVEQGGSQGADQGTDLTSQENAFKALPKSTARPYISAADFRHLQSLTCPPGSKTRSGVSWNMRDLCRSCAGPHSQGQFMRDFEMSLALCHQPDILHLHEFHTLPHRFELYQDLLPLFSRSKTDSFNDILLPLLRPDVSDARDEKSFDEKTQAIIWQGEPGRQMPTHQSMHGGLPQRLAHMSNNATAFDKSVMLLEVESNRVKKEGEENENQFINEPAGVRDVNGPLPLSISYVAPEHCEDLSCQVIREELGFDLRAKALGSRYVVLLDTADGPPPELLPTLRSNSVPLLSTIFREWYTDRLMPWVHFVPIDIRLHGFQSTVAYFVGLKDNGEVNGRNQLMEPKQEDARWIAEQGRKWADKAIRREDMEVYMFRLLLEWGRVMSDDRDNMAFVP